MHPFKGCPMSSADERTLVARIAVHSSWANTADRSARTAPARAAFDHKFLEQAGGDPARAAHLRKAHFARLALKSAQARRRAKGVQSHRGAERDLKAGGGDVPAA